MIDDNIRHRIEGIDLIPASVDEDFHDSLILNINYNPSYDNSWVDITLKTWSHENNDTQDIVVVFHLEDIREFHIDNQTCCFTTCLDIEECRMAANEYWEGCLDFTMDEISVCISAQKISVLSVEAYKQ